jgi:hypothetical protein
MVPFIIVDILYISSQARFHLSSQEGSIVIVAFHYSLCMVE